MANVQYTHEMGQANYGHYAEPSASAYAQNEGAAPGRMTRLTNLFGACLSVGLLVGVGLWGYDLIMRDVSGLPVVRAAEGEMRVRPDDPGGQLALHQGLAVNEVAASGEASGPVDRLVLAPQPVDLRAEDATTDRPVGQLPAQDQSARVDVDQVDDEKIDAMVATLLQRAERADGQSAEAQTDAPAVSGLEASGAKVVKAAMPVPAAQPQVVPNAQDAAVALALRNAPGLKVSARPKLRPTRAVARSTSQAVVTPASATRQTSELTNVPAGTRLVQLGALDTPEKARAQWDVLSARFGDFMQGKQRVITPASTGGHKFYRLRAMGFADLAAARRFCSALIADGAECIPVVTR